MVGIAFVWIALSFIAGAIGSNKGRGSFSFFFLSLILSPLVGIIAALIAKPDQKKLDESKIASGDSKKCPFCAEVIKAEAKVCRYCSRELSESEEVDPIEEENSQEQIKEPVKEQVIEDSNFLNNSLKIIVLIILVVGFAIYWFS